MKNLFFKAMWGLCLTLCAAGCQLHEEPGMTANGEIGIDPTEITVNAQLSVQLTTMNQTMSSCNDDWKNYKHRFIIETFLNDNSSIRQIYYEDIVQERTYIKIPVSMKLHARPYRIAVWSDYVNGNTKEEDLFYNTTTLTPVIGNDGYKGNSDWKDAFYGFTKLDLSDYRNEWNAQISLEMELKRIVGRYTLLATDMNKLMEKVQNGEAADGEFTVRVKYSDYLALGFDILTEELCNKLLYMSYSKKFKLPAEATSDFEIGFDYVFCKDAETKIPIEVEVTDSNKKVVARSFIRLKCSPDMNTTVRDNFLTADPSLAGDGVGIDPDFDEEIDMEVDVI